MTYYKLHNAIKKAGYPKGTYHMHEGGLSFAQLRTEKYPPGVSSYAIVTCNNLADLLQKLKAAGVDCEIYYNQGFAPIIHPYSCIRVGLERNA